MHPWMSMDILTRGGQLYFRAFMTLQSVVPIDVCKTPGKHSTTPNTLIISDNNPKVTMSIYAAVLTLNPKTEKRPRHASDLSSV